jgi:hypothetical protein
MDEIDGLDPLIAAIQAWFKGEDDLLVIIPNSHKRRDLTLTHALAEHGLGYLDV